MQGENVDLTGQTQEVRAIPVCHFCARELVSPLIPHEWPNVDGDIHIACQICCKIKTITYHWLDLGSCSGEQLSILTSALTELEQFLSRLLCEEAQQARLQ